MTFVTLDTCRRSESGVSAVEFALFAPVLAAVFVLMVDVGLALYQRMTLDHILRAGAQVAMSDPGSDKVLEVLHSTANGMTDTDLSGLRFDPEPVRYCACPENMDVDPQSAPPCSTTCANSAHTFIFYNMSAVKPYQSVFVSGFGDISLGSTVKVQIR